MRKNPKEHRKLYPCKYILLDIKQRCNNPKNKSYYRYGGRGIECLITEKELEKLWKRDKAWLLDKPSIDREDNDDHYEYGNCQFIENRINCCKDNYKPIFQFDLEGKFIREWQSQKKAGKELNIDQSNISKCVLGKQKTAFGFIWRFKDV